MIAVDTNVLIYACDQADPRRQNIALDLITNAQDGVLLWQVACEFLSPSRKLSKQGFTSTHAWNRLDEFRDLLPLVLPTDGNLARAKALHLTRGASLWDALIIAACVEAGVDTLTQRTCLDSTTSRASVSSTHSSSRPERGAEEGDATSGRGWPLTDCATRPRRAPRI
jgi:predicted nucleic acid-binding protein